MRLFICVLSIFCSLYQVGLAKPISSKKGKLSSVAGLHRKAVFGYIGRAVDRLYPLLKETISIKKKTITVDNIPQRPLRIGLVAVQVSESLGPDLKGFIHRKMMSRNYRLNSGHWVQFVECLDCSDLKFSEIEGGGLLIDRGGSPFPISQAAVKKYNLDYYLSVNVAYNGAVLIYQMSIYDANTNLLLGSKSDRWWVGDLRNFAFQSGLSFIPYFYNAEEGESNKTSKNGISLYLGGRVYRSVEIGLDFMGVFSLDGLAATDAVDNKEPTKKLFQWVSSHFSLGIPFWEYTSRPVGVIYPVFGFFLGAGYQNSYKDYNPLFLSYGGFFRFDIGKRVHLMLKWMSNTSKNIGAEGENEELTNKMFPSYVSICVGVNFT